MPWSPESFKDRHNHGLSPAQAAHAAHQANAILRSGAPEGTAIAVANKYAETHRDLGGGLGTPSIGGGGLTAAQPPSPQPQNPMVAQMIQRYAALPTDKLAQLAQVMGNSPQGAVIQKLLMQKRTQPNNQAGAAFPTPQQPAVAQAAGGATPGRDMGGASPAISPSQGMPWWTRREAVSDSQSPSLGFLHGPTPGRADAVDTTAPAGSHVIPADVVAGIGEGNSLAGAARMQRVLETGPHGIPLSGGRRGSGPPRPPSPMREAKGGGVPENTPVKLSHGEVVATPEQVLRWGRGDREAGHKALDAWIVNERKKQIKVLQKLPGPVKS